MTYTVTPNNIHIVDSFAIAKKYFDRSLGEIQSAHPDCEVWQRSYSSLKMEWAVHNFLYSLGLWKDRTRDVDLNYPNKWEWAYCIIGVLVWPWVA